MASTDSNTEVAMVSVPVGAWDEIRADIKRALEILTTPKVVGPILTQREAITYVKMETEGGLRSWMSKYAKNARVGHNRYSKARIDIGLAKEAGAIRERISS